MLLRALMLACDIICHRIRQSNISSIPTCLPEECGLNVKYPHTCVTGLEEKKKAMTTDHPEWRGKQDSPESSKNSDYPLFRRVGKHGGYCPVDRGYTRVAVHQLCYKRYVRLINWFEARSLCGQEGGDLIVLNKKTKYSSVNQYMARVSRKRKNYRAWVGMTRTRFSAKYTWFLGHSSRFGGIWSKGETSFGNDYCIVLTASGMADVQCLTHADTICEIQM